MKSARLCAIALTLTLGLAACGDAEAPADQGGTVVPEGENWTAAPDQEGAVDVQLPETPVELNTAGSGDSVSVDKDGVSADVGDGDTRIKAETGESPSLSVTRE